MTQEIGNEEWKLLVLLSHIHLGLEATKNIPLGTIWGLHEESVVSVTASKQMHIWLVPQQRPIYPPAKPRYVSTTALDLWLKSDL